MVIWGSSGALSLFHISFFRSFNLEKYHRKTRFLPTCPCRPGLQAEGQGPAVWQLPVEGIWGPQGPPGRQGPSHPQPGKLGGQQGQPQPRHPPWGRGQPGAAPPSPATGTPTAPGSSSKTLTQGRSQRRGSLVFLDLVRITREQCQIINFPLNIKYL